MQTFDKWYNMLSQKHECHFLVSMDIGDRSMNNIKVKKFLENRNNTLYFVGKNKTKVQAVNANIKESKIDFSILVLISDDMTPKIHGYDDIIYENMIKYFPNMDGCLHFNDGRTGANLNTLSIMGKKLYDYFGYIYNPNYNSLWCDNEYTETTKNMNKSVYIDSIIIEHEWTKRTGKDWLHYKNEKYFGRDKRVYERRKAIGFPK